MDSSLCPHLPDAFLGAAPHDMMRFLFAHFSVEQTADSHELLITKERKMTYTDPETMDDYLNHT